MYTMHVLCIQSTCYEYKARVMYTKHVMYKLCIQSTCYVYHGYLKVQDEQKLKKQRAVCNED